MNYIKRPRWQLSEAEVTPEHIFMNRRHFLKKASALTIGAASYAYSASNASANAETLIANPNQPSDKVLTHHLYPAQTNPLYATAGREITDEEVNSTYNNFYEFGSHKEISKRAQSLNTRPWTIKIEGLVEQEQTIAIDDLILKMGVEERIYRHRCVEAWSMTIPWSGFPLSKLVALARPLSSAKYVEFKTFFDPKIAPGHRQSWYPWPYLEGVTIEEAQNDLAFMVTGAYGKDLKKQFGAPLRLALPWKYGFKSIKSIVSIRFTDKRPVSFWEQLASKEYGFWANVNPAVDHPRWSQKTERVLGSNERIPTLIYNGYGEEVADLYKNLQNERLFM